MQRSCDAAGVALRPHVKGHRSAWIAGRQLEAGASGLAAATLSEAEGLLRAGLGADVLLTSIVPARAVAAIVALRRLGDLAVVADDPAFVAALGERAALDGVRVRVLVDLDVGQRRGGARTAREAVGVADAVRDAPSLDLAGVQGYEGHLQLLPDADRRAGHARSSAALEDLLGALRRAGHDVRRVTGAGTGTRALAASAGLLTEVQPGSYALMDATYAQATEAGFGQAAHVLTAVRSVLADDEVIVDAGLKALSTDLGPAAVAGRNATWEPAGDEHGRVRGDLAGLAPGALLRLVPSHTDTTVALHRRLWLLDGDAAPVAVPLF